MPFLVADSILAGIHECGRNADLGSDQMLPLVPGRIPAERQERGIDVDLGFPAAVPVERESVIKVDAAQGRSKASLGLVREIAEKLANEKSLAIVGLLARYNTLAAAPVREQRRRVGVTKQSVIAGPQFRVHQKIEGPLDRAQLFAPAGRGQFQAPDPVAQPQIGKRGCGGSPKQVVQSCRSVFARASHKEVEVIPNGGTG